MQVGLKVYMHRRLGSYSHAQASTLNRCRKLARKNQVEQNRWSKIGRLRRRSSLGRQVYACTCTIQRAHLLVYYIWLKSHLSIHLSVCLSVCSFSHTDNSAVSASMKTVLAQDESCVLKDNRVYFTSIQQHHSSTGVPRRRV